MAVIRRNVPGNEAQKKRTTDPYEHDYQVEGQYYIDGTGNIVEEGGELIDSETALEPGESTLELLKPGKFDPRNFHTEFNDNSEKVLYELLSMQSNSAPLKHGGEGIAFRADIILQKNRQLFSIAENNLFDLISGVISSNPDDVSYIITGKDAAQRLSYVHTNNAYRVIKDAANSLAGKPLLFEITTSSGKKRNLKVAWYEVLTYVERDVEDDEEEAYISFQPTKFFKALMISSSVTHGSHYSIKVSSQISSKYVRNLYYFLESRKKYKRTPVSNPGEVEVTVDELREMLGFPDSYKSSDIRRNILDPALEMNMIDGIDFNFTYELLKKGRKVNSVLFKITDINEILVEAKEVDTTSSVDEAVMMILETQDFSEEECLSIYKAYVENKRNMADLTNAIIKLATADGIENRVGFMISLLKDDHIEAPRKKSGGNKKSSMKNFKERDNDYKELQEELLRKSMEK